MCVRFNILVLFLPGSCREGTVLVFKGLPGADSYCPMVPEDTEQESGANCADSSTSQPAVVCCVASSLCVRLFLVWIVVVFPAVPVI